MLKPLAALFVAIVAAPALAADADAAAPAIEAVAEAGTEVGAAAAQAESGAMAMLQSAVALAASHKGERFAFTMEYQEEGGDLETPATFRGRFDPSADEMWSLLAPALDDLPKRVRGEVKKFRKNEDSDETLVYDGLGDLMKGVSLLEETDDAAVFVTRDLGEDAPKDKLEARIYLDKAQGYVSKIEVIAIDSFKPLPIVKVNEMIQVQTFDPPRDGLPALMRESTSHVVGKAMFKKFESKSKTLFSDIERVAVAPEAGADAVAIESDD